MQEQQGFLQQKTEKETQEKLTEQQRKFRNLESDRKAYAEETVANIKKQWTIIEKLKNENNALKDLIAKLNQQQSKNNLGITGFDRQDNENVIAELKQRLDEEIKLQYEINRNIKDFNNKIIEKKSHLGGINAGQETQIAMNKQVKILENRLDKANQKFNEAIAINKDLRQQIDSLRRERVIFDNLYKKLEKELHEKRKEMAMIIEVANTAYEDRDKANDFIQSLKHQAKRESSDFENNLRELSLVIEKNKKALEFIKNTEKKNKDEQSHINDQNDIEKYNKQIKQDKKNKDRNISQNNLEQMQKYEEDFAKIQAATGIKIFNTLVKIFTQNEEENFKAFKYVNDQSNNIEEYEKQIEEVREEKMKLQCQESNVDVIKKKTFKEYEEKLQKSKKKQQEYEFLYNNTLKLIQSLIPWIENLFNVTECEKNVAKELAGTYQVTDTNMLIFLGIIEDRVNQILQSYAQITLQRGNESLYSINQIPNITANLNQQINKNKTEILQLNEEIESDEHEGNNKPFTSQEFRDLALKKLEKMDNKKNQIGTKSKLKQSNKQGKKK